jgi:hypothetical protein
VKTRAKIREREARRKRKAEDKAFEAAQRDLDRVSGILKRRVSKGFKLNRSTSNDKHIGKVLKVTLELKGGGSTWAYISLAPFASLARLKSVDSVDVKVYDTEFLYF